LLFRRLLHSQNSKILADRLVLIEPRFKGVTLGFVNDYSNEKYAFWNAIYKKETTEKQLKKIVSEVLGNSFAFTELNTQKFKVDTVIDIAIFEKKYGIDLNKTRQKALIGGLSSKNSCSNKIHVEYDFGETILLTRIIHEFSL